MKYRKIPVVIDAWQWNGEKEGEMQGVCQCSSNRCPHLHTANENTIDDRGQLVFLTEGDWIIPESNKPGRFYPFKPDVFAKTYVPEMPTVEANMTPAQLEESIRLWFDEKTAAEGIVRLQEAQLSRECGDNITARLKQTGLGPDDEIEWDEPLEYVAAMNDAPAHLGLDLGGEEQPMRDSVLHGLDVARSYIVEQRSLIEVLRAQLEAEGAHTEAANAEIERITKAARQ